MTAKVVQTQHFPFYVKSIGVAEDMAKYSVRPEYLYSYQNMHSVAGFTYWSLCFKTSRGGVY